MCNCREGNAAAVVHTNAGFNEFLWLLVIVVGFGSVMALLFFLCEILSKTTKQDLKKVRNQKKPPKKVGYPGLVPPVPVPVPIPTISKKVESEQESQLDSAGSLFGIRPPPPVPPSFPGKARAAHVTSAPNPALIPVTRTIPAYRMSPGLVSQSRIQTRSLPLTSSPPKSSAVASDAQIVQELVSTQTTTPPKPLRPIKFTLPKKETDKTIVSHSPEMVERRITIPIPPKPSRASDLGATATGAVSTQSQKMEEQHQRSAPPVIGGGLVKSISSKPQVDLQAEVHRGTAVVTSSGMVMTDNANATSSTKSSTRTTMTEIEELIRKGSTRLTTEESSSKTLAHSIMSRLFRGQQESDLLFRQIQSLEKKMELMFVEFGRRNNELPEKVTQGVQTHGLLVRNDQTLVYSEPMERNTSTETIVIEETRVPNGVRMLESVEYDTENVQRSSSRLTESPIRVTESSTQQNYELKPTIQTTTQVISLEAVPITHSSVVETHRPPSVPPLVHSLKIQEIEKSSYTDSGEDSSEGFSLQSDSPDFNRIPVFEVQRILSTFNEESSMKENKLNFQAESSHSVGRTVEELKEEALRRQYEKELNETLTQLRADCQQRVVENLGEQRFLYSKREFGLQKEVGSLSSAIETQGSVLASLQWKLGSFEKNITKLADEKELLESCAREVKTGWEADKRTFNEDKQRLEGLLEKMRAERAELLRGYQHLVGVKVALDSELIKYKALVEEEEQRLPMVSPARVGHAGITSPSETTSERTFTVYATENRQDTDEKSFITTVIE